MSKGKVYESGNLALWKSRSKIAAFILGSVGIVSVNNTKGMLIAPSSVARLGQLQRLHTGIREPTKLMCRVRVNDSWYQLLSPVYHFLSIAMSCGRMSRTRGIVRKPWEEEWSKPWEKFLGAVAGEAMGSRGS